MMKKKGQVTIFVILAILIVAGIIVFFLYANRGGESSVSVNPKSSVVKCVQSAVGKSVEKILANGGMANQGLSLQYRGVNFSYLCYTGDYYLTCYNLYPMIFDKIESDVVEDTKGEVQNCFNSMREDFESHGYVVDGDTTSYSTSLLPGKVKINLNKKITVTNGDNSQSFNEFGTEILTPTYELVRIAHEIVNSEAKYCNFEYNGYMLLYSQYKIQRFDYEGSKIYRVTDRLSGKEFRFAVRSCAFPPGI